MALRCGIEWGLPAAVFLRLDVKKNAPAKATGGVSGLLCHVRNLRMPVIQA